MFSVWCDSLRREVLIWPSSLQGVDNEEGAIVLHYRCACGEAGALFTGRHVSRDSSGHVGSSGRRMSMADSATG